MVRRDTTKPGRQDASSDRARQPRHSSGTVSARSGERSRAALVAPSLQSFLRGGCSAPGRHCAYPRDFAQALSTMDRHLSAAVASSASLCASDGLLTGWIRPQLGGSAFGLSEGPEVNETAGDLTGRPRKVTGAPAGVGEVFRQLLELYSRFRQSARFPGRIKG